MRYLTLFPEAENVHLIKDVGMIPYSLAHYQAYEGTLLCYRNGSYTYQETDLKGLQLIFLRRISGNATIDGILFLLAQGRKYDVLQTFHLRLRSLLWLWLFKILRPSGRTYLKLDANERILDQHFGGIKGKLKRYLLQKIDLISVENTQLQEALSHKWKRKIAYIPNGFYQTEQIDIPYAQKRNEIITVGRIGAPEKRNEVLVTAFTAFAADFPGWTLKLIGPVEPAFASYMSTFISKHPEIRDRIILTGAIKDRAALSREYAMAKIFCITSAMEGFPIVFPEAASAGCFVVTSAIIAAKDITNNEKYGRIFPIDDTATLTKILADTAGNEPLMERTHKEIRIFAQNRFSWPVLARQINDLIKNSNTHGY